MWAEQIVPAVSSPAPGGGGSAKPRRRGASARPERAMIPLAVPESLFDYLEELGALYALAVARPFGLSIVFFPFAWGHMNSGIIRMAFAIAIAMPIAAPAFANPTPLLEGLALGFVPTLVKELFVGLVLGAIASVPFAVFLGGGAVIDFYRGGFQGAPDPAGGTVPAYGRLFTVVGLWMFAALGGFWLTTDVIYASYNAYPIAAGFPSLLANGAAFLSLLARIALGALVLGGPIILAMFLSDMTFLMSSKFGKSINVTHLAFPMKNLVALVALPFYSFVLIRLVKGELTGGDGTLTIMRQLFG